MNNLDRLNTILLVDDDDASNFLHSIFINKLDMDVNINSALNFFKSLSLPNNQIIKGPDQDDADSIISSAALRFFSRNKESWRVPNNSQKEGWIFGV